jgi:hypothetical protein
LDETQTGKTVSRAKAQSTPSSETWENILRFAPWRLGAINFFADILLISSAVRI